VRKLAVLLGVLLAIGGGFGARALASHATATVDPGPPPCATVSVAVDGTPVDATQTQCAPTGAPGLPAPTPPALPGPPSLPNPPSLPAPPNVPVPAPPSLPGAPGVPNLPGVPPVAGANGAALGSGCQFTSARSNPPAAGEVTTTLPDGTVIYRYPGTPDPTALSGYMGGTNTLGTLEGSGSAGPNGVTGQIGGHNNQTGADGYIGSNGACLNGNSLP